MGENPIEGSPSYNVCLPPEVGVLAERVAARRGVTPSEYLSGLVVPLIRRDATALDGGTEPPGGGPDMEASRPDPGPSEPPEDIREQLRKERGERPDRAP